ncbi:hypothetical protein, partial [uncultured Gammaproteobacteria bacterium]
LCCDLHLGDSQLQSCSTAECTQFSCDLHLGDSQLQYEIMGYLAKIVVICI